MTDVVAFEEDVSRMICGHVLQSSKGRKKNTIYYEMKGEWDIHNAEDLVMCLGEFNGHMGRPTDGFHGVHGWYGGGQRNLEGHNMSQYTHREQSTSCNSPHGSTHPHQYTHTQGAVYFL